MAAVRIESKAFTDARLKILARKLNVSWHQVLGIMADLWRECTEEETYYLDGDTIDAIANIEMFSQFLVASKLGKIEGAQIYIVGSRGKIEWLGEKRKNGRKGGRPKSLEIKENKPNDNLSVTYGEPNCNPPALAPAPALINNLFYTYDTDHTNDQAGHPCDDPSVRDEKIDFSLLQAFDKKKYNQEWLDEFTQCEMSNVEIQQTIDHFCFDVGLSRMKGVKNAHAVLAGCLHKSKSYRSSTFNKADFDRLRHNFAISSETKADE